MYSYKLFNTLKQYAKDGLVTVSNFEDLMLFKYSAEAASNKEWTPELRAARGIIFRNNGELIARPMPKFFNLNEHEETKIENLPNLPYEVWDKLDGSCGIGYKYNGKWKLATPGSFISSQAQVGTDLFISYDLEPIPDGVTPIFEIIYPENRIVVDYGPMRALVLLSVIELNGSEWSSNRVNELARRCRFERPKAFIIDPKNPKFEPNTEGYVVHFSNGLRVKIKSGDYVKVHRLLNYMSPSGVIDLIQGNEYSVTFDMLPKYFQRSMDDIRANVNTRFYDYMNLLKSLYSSIPDGSRKEKAIYIQKSINKRFHSIMFLLMDNKYSEHKVWDLVKEDLAIEQTRETGHDQNIS